MQGWEDWEKKGDWRNVDPECRLESVSGTKHIEPIYKILNFGSKTSKKFSKAEKARASKYFSTAHLYSFLLEKVPFKNLKKTMESVRTGSSETFRLGSGRYSDPLHSFIAICAASQLLHISVIELLSELVAYCNGKGISIPPIENCPDLVTQLHEDATEMAISRLTPSSNATPPKRIELVHGEDKWLNPYNPDEIPFVGREAEIERLDEFITDEASFKIWAISAPSGAGKTRLVVHWVTNSEALEGWDCHMLLQDDMSKLKQWAEWEPNNPTLIIVDCLYGVDNLLAILVSRCELPLQHAVRLLIVDHEVTVPLHMDKRWGYSAFGISMDLKEYLFFDLNPLDLTETKDQEKIISDIISSLTELDTPSDEVENAKNYLRNSQGAWQPLYAALVADAINQNRKYSVWNRRDLIRYFLGDDRLPWQGGEIVGFCASSFVAAATAFGGVRLTSLLGISALDDGFLIDDFDEVLNVCRKIIQVNSQYDLYPLVPDLLGESFFLLFIRKLMMLPKILIAFSLVLDLGGMQERNKYAIKFVGFVSRLSRNLIDEDLDAVQTKDYWDALVHFLGFERFRDRSFVEFVSQLCLVEIASELRSNGDRENMKFILKIINADIIYRTTDADLVDLAVDYSLKHNDLVEC